MVDTMGDYTDGYAGSRRGEVRPTTTDKPPTIEEIAARLDAGYPLSAMSRMYADMRTLLAEVEQRDKELDELRDCDMCEICEDHH